MVEPLAHHGLASGLERGGGPSVLVHPLAGLFPAVLVLSAPVVAAVVAAQGL